MSDPLRIALVAEGPTDRVLIGAALRVILQDRAFVLNQLQPEGSTVFGQTGTGWAGVYKWCKQAAQYASLDSEGLVFQNHDLLVLHLDADVAGEEYENGSILSEPSDSPLPCEHPCPPASATTDALRAVLLSWCGKTTTPARTVLCTPSKGTEAWVVAALFPTDLAVVAGIECFRDPESRLGQQPKKRRISKKVRDYLESAPGLEAAWPELVAGGTVSEAHRFQADVVAALMI